MCGCPELFNRIDEVLVFRPLDETVITQIAKIQCEKLSTRMEKQGISLSFEAHALAVLAEAGHDPELGARPLKREIQRLVETPLARAMLAEQVIPGGAYRVVSRGGILKIEPYDSL